MLVILSNIAININNSIQIHTGKQNGTRWFDLYGVGLLVTY